ncbi:DUF3987 domain-containing protein, partial [Paralimibaculum aggregatum]|uniref:DUF3987 domain-containing protein n=1 Tax=Paralimibaculum aggregatum TaxID=3036245 RepID=UPI0025560021
MKLRDACAAAPEIQPALPKPIILQTTKARAYPVESLGPLRDAVEAVQERSMAPVALCAQSALAAASLSVQGFADIETLGGVRPVSIYALSIAGSGERKSASYAPFMDVIKQVEREAMQAHRTTLGSWRNRHAIWKGRRDSILGTARQGSGALDATNADLDALGPEPVAPPLPYRLANEPTYEGLIRLFAEGAPSLGVFSDEAGQFLGG